MDIASKIFDGFCLCEIQKDLIKYMNSVKQPTYHNVRQVKTINTFDFSKNGERLKAKLEPLSGTGEYFIFGKKKAQACKAKKISKRRSRFTGVTRNSINYQTLIVVKGKKTYVGSFPLEIHAAITFDFYSILLHGEKASTNFSWRCEDVVQMIDSFNGHEGHFKPEEFEYKIMPNRI